jgi:hypothetical protein
VKGASARALGAGAGLLLLAACAPASPRVADMSVWTGVSDGMMIEKYGQPDRLEAFRLTWDRRGPWKRIVVWEEPATPENGGVSNNIEETIAYRVPADKRDALASFSRGLQASVDGAELSARSTGEERNFLMLNLADAIVQGRMSPQDARVSYLVTLQLAAAGKSSPSMRRLLFR